MSAELGISASLRVATYNVHGCVGIDGKRSEERIAEVIAALDVDIVGLQELDLNRRRSGGRNQAAWLADCLGWASHFFPAMRVGDEEYGDAILSRYPMVLRKAGVLPCRPSIVCPEPRGALWVEVHTPHGSVHVMNTHFGLGWNERLAQARILLAPDWLGQIPESDPLIVLGDFNSAPGSSAYRELALRLSDARSFSRWRALRTYPTRFPLLAVNHIFVNQRLCVDEVRVGQGGQTRVASDHYPLIASVRLVSGSSLE